VHIDLLTGRVRLVSTFKTASVETASRNYVNGVIADDVLCTFAGDRAYDWPEFVPLAEFAINDSMDSLSPLGSGNTPFYADRAQPRVAYECGLTMLNIIPYSGARVGARVSTVDYISRGG
jgi:hypothetical protein